MREILDRQWKKGYVVKWKQLDGLHILVTECVQVEYVRLLYLPECDVVGLSLGSVVSCGMERDFL